MSSKKRKKKGITIRTLDKEGNVVIKKFRRKEPRIKLPSIPPKKIPQITFGAIFGTYALIAYLDSIGSFTNSSNGLFRGIHSFFTTMNPILQFAITGIVGTTIATFLGYAIFTQGFNPKKWNKSFRQLVTITIVVLIFTSLISPFFIEPYIVRQIPDNQFKPNNTQFDLSKLTSPFYDELSNALMKLLNGMTPNLANQIVANVTPTDGLGLNPQRDIYLFRWQISDTWDPTANDFKQGDTVTTMPFIPTTVPTTGQDPSSLRSFQISNSYYTIGSTYNQPLLSFWNSLYGSQLADTKSYSYFSNNNVSLVSSSVVRGVNEQPRISAKFSQSTSQGGIVVPAVWKAEDKSSISSRSVPLSQISNYFAGIPSDRVPATKLQSNGAGVSSTWGVNSLPGQQNYIYQNQQIGVADAFTRKYNEFKNSFAGNTSVYSATVAVTNFIQSVILDAYQKGTLSLDPVQGQPTTGGSTDKGHYFYQALESNGALSWGLKELLPGYVNMLRSFNIPTRLVLGLAGGAIQGNEIQLKMKDIHYWVESLIPWQNSTGTYYSWAIFNPIPIFSQLANGIVAYGRNAMSTQTKIKVSTTSGKSSVPQIPFNLQTFGNNFQINVSASLSGSPAANQNLLMKFYDEQTLLQVQSGSIKDPTTAGITFGNFQTNSKGYYLLNGTVNDLGNLTIGTSTTVITTVKAMDIAAAINPGSGLPTNGYGIAAISGLSYNYTGIGWIRNGTSVLVGEKLVPQTISGVNATGYIVTPEVGFNLVTTLYKSSTQSPSNVMSSQSVSLLLFTQSQYNSLNLANLGQTAISNAKSFAQGIMTVGSNPSTTNSTGNSKWKMTFSFNKSATYPVNDQIYFFLAYWEGTSIFSNPVAVLVSSQAAMLNSAYFNTSVISSGKIYNTWQVNTTMLSVATLLAQPAGIANAPLQYMFVNKALYDGAGITDYNSFATFIAGQTESSAYYNLSKVVTHPTTYASGGLITDSLGNASSTLNVNASDIGAGQYYVIVVSDGFSRYNLIKNGTSSTFFVISVASPPASGLNLPNTSRIEPLKFQTISPELNAINKGRLQK